MLYLLEVNVDFLAVEQPLDSVIDCYFRILCHVPGVAGFGIVFLEQQNDTLSATNNNVPPTDDS